MKTLIALAALLSIAAPAFAQSREDVILNHPVLQAVEKLMSSSDQCVMPEAKDIMWMCTGAIPPVRSPEIDRTGCGFAVEVKCATKTAQVSGQEIQVYLNSPNPTTVKPLEVGTFITNVQFK